MDLRSTDLFLKEDHTQSCAERYKTMAKIPEHDCEEERKCDNGEQCRIDLLVSCNTIRIYNCLEAFCKLVRAMVRGRLFICPNLLQNGRNTRSSGFLLASDKYYFRPIITTYCRTSEAELDLRDVAGGNPPLCQQSFLPRVVLE